MSRASTRPKAGPGVTATALGRHLDLTRQRIDQLVADGVLQRPPTGGFDQNASRIAYVRWLRSAERRTSRAERDGRLRDARVREVEIRNAKADHSLIEMAEAETVLDEVIAIVLGELTALPAQVTRDLTLRDRIEAEIDRIRARIDARLEAQCRALKVTGEALD